MKLRAKIAISFLVEKTGLWCYKSLHKIFNWFVNKNDWYEYMTICNGNEVRK
jgi:hypothetical protein